MPPFEDEVKTVVQCQFEVNFKCVCRSELIKRDRSNEVAAQEGLKLQRENGEIF